MDSKLDENVNILEDQTREIRVLKRCCARSILKSDNETRGLLLSNRLLV